MCGSNEAARGTDDSGDSGSAMDPLAVSVVGLGASGWPSLTAEAREVVERAGTVLGGRRQLDLLPPEVTARRVTWGKPLRPSIRPLVEEHAPAGLVVLASGDPWHYGVGTTLAEELGLDAPDARYRMHVIPGVSSVNLACARMHWPVEGVEVVTAVGRDPAAVLRHSHPGMRMVVLVSRGDAVAEVSAILAGAGYGASDVQVLGELGGPDESRTGRTASAWLRAESLEHLPRLAVLAITVVEDGIETGSRSPGLVTGLADDLFVTDNQLTKWEVRAVTMAALAPRPGRLLWDVGAGNGTVAIEWCRAHPSCRAVAIEAREDRAANITANAKRFGVSSQLTVVTGRAPDVLAELEQPHTVFVGGGLALPDTQAAAAGASFTGGATDASTGSALLDACWSAIPVGGRLVANTVTLESEATLIGAQASHGGELGLIRVDRTEPIGNYTGWSSSRPVVQWRVTKYAEPATGDD